MQPIQWSSEYYDDELALVYYNYRYYNPEDGRWTQRDENEYNSKNLFSYVNNKVFIVDSLGLIEVKYSQSVGIGAVVALDLTLNVDGESMECFYGSLKMEGSLGLGAAFEYKLKSISLPRNIKIDIAAGVKLIVAGIKAGRIVDFKYIEGKFEIENDEKLSLIKTGSLAIGLQFIEASFDYNFEIGIGPKLKIDGKILAGDISIKGEATCSFSYSYNLGIGDFSLGSGGDIYQFLDEKYNEDIHIFDFNLESIIGN